ncbi:MAG: aminoacetone oxidase family FAD-binding enzyme [Lachnospiraceae bacterium]|nr:aminoacetone oxidase family FAD-binding enzyme [Lachnospiraceae bacterium]
MAKRVVIIGGGAAGCMAAIAAGRAIKNMERSFSEAKADGSAESPRVRVTLVEKNSELCKKILSTGNGRCNYCHDVIVAADYHRDENDPFINTVSDLFPPEKVIGLFKDLGIMSLNRDGYIYPYSEQARAVRDVLKKRVYESGASVVTDCEVTAIERSGSVYLVRSGKQVFEADTLILTTGGAAAPKTGSDGRGFSFCESLGHHIVKPVPALTYLTVKDHPFYRAFGIRLMAKVSIEEDGVILSGDTGQIQITKTGISGIPVFNVSRYACRALSENKEVKLHIRMVPGLSDDELKKEILRRISDANNTPYEALVGLIPDSLADSLLKHLKIDPDKKTDDPVKAADVIYGAMLDTVLTVNGSGDMSSAQMTCGGVSTDEIDPAAMRSLISKDLYLAGEIIDIDGKCGGYNLFFSWASGYIAGRAACEPDL